MEAGSLFSIAFLTNFLLFIGATKANNNCSPSSCGNILNITSPFRLKSDPKMCGDSRYQLSCENNFTVFYFDSTKFLVQAINYDNPTIRIVDSNVQKDNCSSVPNHAVDDYSFRYGLGSLSNKVFEVTDTLVNTVVFLTCENPVNSSLYIEASPCVNEDVFASNSHDEWSESERHNSSYYYYVVKGGLHVSDLKSSCRIERTTLISSNAMKGRNTSYMDIQNELAFGFELQWLPTDHPEQKEKFRFHCSLGNSNTVLCSVIEGNKWFFLLL